ncbi:MAG: peptidylprolyl isomerase [Candidatus Competibacteraceae bacterium]
METNFGPIVLELDEEKAPQTVDNFLQYARDGFYEGTIFHRVIDNFMIQGGGFSADYRKKPTRDPIANEANNGLKNVRGSIAMARTSDPHSATAQFFINVTDNAFLDYPGRDGWGYTVFGKVTEGMDVVDKIRQVPTGSGGPFAKDVPQNAVIIEQVTVTDVPTAPTPSTDSKPGE